MGILSVKECVSGCTWGDNRTKLQYWEIASREQRIVLDALVGAQVGEGGQRTEEPDGRAPTRRRLEAEKRARVPTPEEVEALSTAQVQELIHELRVHQIELEMQNDELREAQLALQSSRARFHDLYDRAPVGYVTLDEQSVILETNLTTASILGVPSNDLVGQALTRFILPDDQDAFYQLRKQLFPNGGQGACELRMLRAQGDPFWARMDATVVPQGGGNTCRLTLFDVSDRKRGEQNLLAANGRLETVCGELLDARRQLEESNQQLRQAERGLTVRNRIARSFLTVPDEHMFAAVLAIVLDAMESPLGVFGYIDQRGDLLVPSMTESVWDQCQVAGKTIRFPREAWGDSSWPRAIREKRTNFSNEPSSSTPDGHPSIRRHISVPLVHQGKVVGLFQVANKGTDYSQEDVAFLEALGRATAPVLDARLRRDEVTRERERLLSAIEQAGDMVVITDPEGIIQYVNPAFERATGYSRQEALGQNPRMLKSGEHDDAFYRRLWETLASGQTFAGRMVNKRKDGTKFTEEATISPVFDTWGKVVSFVAVKHDITGQLRMEDELRQAQKMESVGRLAGGVAHDFNNMLGVILGYADFALLKLTPSDPLYGDLMEIRKAAQRSADITRQLLAFARKQAIVPEVLDLNAAVEATLKMLRRLIGEDIELVWQPKGRLWPVKMDPAQLDQILANLCVNARDAIMNTGRVTIETDQAILDDDDCADRVDVAPGEFVVLSVSDNGCGMDRETMDHLFEPFFTTKELGMGTGLGLATTFGIVKQNGGFIRVDSELGGGSTFRIYLPRHVGVVEPSTRGDSASVPKGRGETVLMVEDESAILRLGERMLSRLGYRVLTACSPGEALHFATEYSTAIDLIITDVVMPEMNGHELVERLLAVCPNVPVMYMSGHTASVIEERGVLESGIHFLQKPFSTRELADKVRALLDQRPAVV